MAEERQETGKKKGNEKGEVSRNLPRNYRQIGEPGAKKIYVEDYVYTYLNKLAQPENLYARGAILFGKMYKTTIGKCMFISGAAACQNFELDLDETIFSEENWGEIYRIRDSFFPELEICGWFLSRMGFSVDLNDKIIRIHMDNFSGENKVLYMIDALENEDAFYQFENYSLKKQYFGGMTAMVIMIGVAAFILIRSNNKYRKKMKSEKQDDVFQQMLSSKDKAVVWNLLRQHVRENLVKVLDFAANTYGQMTDGFIREDLKSLRKAVSSTNDEKDILKKIRRKETLGMRRIDRNVAIEKNTWFHLGSNSSEQMMYCLKRMCEPCKEHVDNNFNPLPAECAEEFVPIRDMLKSLLERTKDIIDKGNYEEADLVLAEGEELKTCLSRLHKMRIERMQEENSSVKLSLVYLNLLQESQELVSIMRHMLRASRKFQHV